PSVYYNQSPAYPQISSKKVDLKTLFSKKEVGWDCDVCCARNAPTSAVCVACRSSAPTAAKVKPVEELKISAPVAPPAKLFSFGVFGDSTKNTASTDVSLKGFTSGSQIPAFFRFGLKDAVLTSSGFGAQADKKTIQPDAPQHDKVSAVPFGNRFGTQFAKKEGQRDCDSFLVGNNALYSTEKSNTTSQGGLFAEIFAKKYGQWDCDTCLGKNEATSSHCVSCQKANPNIKNKTPAASSSSSFTFSSGSSVCQPAVTTFKANFNPGIPFQFGKSNDKAPLEGFKFKSSTNKQSQNGSANDLTKNDAELHKVEDKEAAISSSDQPVDACGHDNKPLNT
ncbi:hypothetical protein M9458_026056, partial [Cirrhinus mrigala]